MSCHRSVPTFTSLGRPCSPRPCHMSMHVTFVANLLTCDSSMVCHRLVPNPLNMPCSPRICLVPHVNMCVRCDGGHAMVGVCRLIDRGLMFTSMGRPCSPRLCHMMCVARDSSRDDMRMTCHRLVPHLFVSFSWSRTNLCKEQKNIRLVVDVLGG